MEDAVSLPQHDLKLIARISCTSVYRSETLSISSGWGESDLENKNKSGQC